MKLLHQIKKNLNHEYEMAELETVTNMDMWD